MKRKIPFTSILGALSGVFSVVAGFLFSLQEVGHEVAHDPEQDADLFSYFFGQQASTGDETVHYLLWLLCRFVEKGFALVLIFFGLFTVFYFGSKVEHAMRRPVCPPPVNAMPPFMPPQGQPPFAPAGNPGGGMPCAPGAEPMMNNAPAPENSEKIVYRGDSNEAGGQES